MDKLDTLKEIKAFLNGYDNDFKYLVNVEVDPKTNIADCIIHEPDTQPKIVKRRYEPFIYMKDLLNCGHILFAGHTEQYVNSIAIKYGVKIIKLKTGNQKRLVDGYCFKLTSSKSYNSILNYLRDGGINPYEKAVDSDGNIIKNAKGEPICPNRHLIYSPRLSEQFFISTKTRLFKGFEQYKNIHKLTFDIETTGLRYQMSRVFSIGVRDNRGFETILEASKLNDDDSEIRLIQDFFNLINHIRPAIISGYNSEMFDFEFLLGRAKLLKMDMNELPTSLKEGVHLKRRPNTSVKYGNTADKYTATEMWGYSIIDIIHASKKTAAVNSEIKATGLKYISKHEKISKPNRTYIKGEDNSISRFYAENKMFVISEDNIKYVQIPDDFQEIGKKLYILQGNKERISNEEFNRLKINYLDENKLFVDWYREVAVSKGMTKFISGKKLLRQYLLDDLWETEQVDELYNQSSFMLAKIIPTTYQRICTMGTAAIWNLLLTTWSYENDLAIPVSDKNEKFSGGLARCYKVGYSRRIKKIDYSSLYPMIQLSEGVFPILDITGVIKKILLYLTTTRNIYKKMGNGDELNNEEIELLKEIDPDVYHRFSTNTLTNEDKALFKIKQLPVKILNNSLFGALGSAISFNWSDNVCAARITCVGRLHLRHAIHWFSEYDCIALDAVTDGINFQYPEFSKIRITDDGVSYEEVGKPIEEMWRYNKKIGMNALIDKYNIEEMKPPFMSVDDDGDYISILNLTRINNGKLILSKDRKTGKMIESVKLTGNTIKSKAMPEYIEEFIDNGLNMILHGQGSEFVKYYHDYCDNIYYMQIPLKKIANKSKVKMKLSSYIKRGTDKNGREKAKQAHMELLLEKRNDMINELFEKYESSFDLSKYKKELTIDDKLKFIGNYMPQEPELDSVIYYYNTGYIKSHGDSKLIIDKETGEERYASTIIDSKDLDDNPNIIGKYNYAKYLAGFNKRVKSLLVGFEPEVQKKILTKIDKKGDLIKEMFKSDELILKNFNHDNLDESMYLEELEVEFWNKTGYDPRLIWNGFKMHEDDMVYYEIYQNALDFLNKRMIENNKQLIKSINDPYLKGDLVLIKNGKEYCLGAYNGIYFEIVRENIEIPKTAIEIELEGKLAERERKLEELRLNDLTVTMDYDALLKADNEKREKYFLAFKKKFNVPSNYTMEELFTELDNSEGAFNDFIAELKNELEDEAVESGSFDDDSDSAY